MKPSKRIYCRECGRSKLLFETEQKALRFIKFNADEIEAETGRKPERAYYCVCCGGWHTTSMKNNSIKSNYTIDEIHWSLYPKGDISDWDGLTTTFLQLVRNDKELLNDAYIKSWYKVSQIYEDRLKG